MFIPGQISCAQGFRSASASTDVSQLHCNWPDSFMTEPAPPFPPTTQPPSVPLPRVTHTHTHTHVHAHTLKTALDNEPCTLEMYALMPSASLMHGSPKSWASWSGMSWSLSRALSRLRHLSSSVTPWLRTYKTKPRSQTSSPISQSEASDSLSDLHKHNRDVVV